MTITNKTVYEEVGIKPSAKTSMRRAIREILARSKGPIPVEDLKAINLLCSNELKKREPA